MSEDVASRGHRPTGFSLLIRDSWDWRICYGFMVLGLVEGRVCLQVEGKSLALWHNFWICEEQICAVGGCGFSWTSSN